MNPDANPDAVNIVFAKAKAIRAERAERAETARREREEARVREERQMANDFARFVQAYTDLVPDLRMRFGLSPGQYTLTASHGAADTSTFHVEIDGPNEPLGWRATVTRRLGDVTVEHSYYNGASPDGIEIHKTIADASDLQNVLLGAMGDYTDEPTRIRLYNEQQVGGLDDELPWSIDGADDWGRYTEDVRGFRTEAEARAEIENFRAQYPSLAHAPVVALEFP